MDLQTQYRVHITIRRKGQPVHISQEFKTEHVGTFDELSETMDRFVTEEIEMDNEAYTSLEG